MKAVLLNNPEAREAFFRAAQAQGTATGTGAAPPAAVLPENFEELGAREQATVLRDYFVAEARAAVAPELAAARQTANEVARIRAEETDRREYQELVQAHPEAANAPPEIEQRVNAYLDRFASLPRDQQPTLMDAYRTVMAPTWQEEARRARVQGHAEPRRAAAGVAHPGAGANSAGEMVLDVRQYPSDRDAFKHAANEALRLLNLT